MKTPYSNTLTGAAQYYTSNIFQHYSPNVFNEVLYLLKQSDGDVDAVMTIFEDHQMWEHAMCLDEMQLQK